MNQLPLGPLSPTVSDLELPSSSEARKELEEVGARLKAFKRYQNSFYLLKKKKIEIQELEAIIRDSEAAYPEFAQTKNIIFGGKKKKEEKKKEEEKAASSTPKRPRTDEIGVPNTPLDESIKNLTVGKGPQSPELDSEAHMQHSPSKL